jgi:hypothetical protein
MERSLPFGTRQSPASLIRDLCTPTRMPLPPSGDNRGQPDLTDSRSPDERRLGSSSLARSLSREQLWQNTAHDAAIQRELVERKE